MTPTVLEAPATGIPTTRLGVQSAARETFASDEIFGRLRNALIRQREESASLRLFVPKGLRIGRRSPREVAIAGQLSHCEPVGQHIGQRSGTVREYADFGGRRGAQRLFPRERHGLPAAKA